VKKLLVLILDERVIEIPKNKFAQYNRAPTVGERGANPSQPDGSPIDVTITEVTESKVTVDFNHPLAGEELTIDIELVDIDYGAH
jgi:FKBP-type peptidyl-prolyl cis-trans isomerase 2